MQWCFHRHPDRDRWYLFPAHRMDDFCRLFVAGMQHEPDWLVVSPQELHYSFLRFDNPEVADFDMRQRIREVTAMESR